MHAYEFIKDWNLLLLIIRSKSCNIRLSIAKLDGNFYNLPNSKNIGYISILEAFLCGPPTIHTYTNMQRR